jgi:hypothetical protein
MPKGVALEVYCASWNFFLFTIWRWKALAPSANHGILAPGFSELNQFLQIFQIILGSGGGKTFFGKSKMGWLF